MLGHRLSHFRKLLRNLNHHLGHHTSSIKSNSGSLFLAHSWRNVQNESHTQVEDHLSVEASSPGRCERLCGQFGQKIGLLLDVIVKSPSKSSNDAQTLVRVE